MLPLFWSAGVVVNRIDVLVCELAESAGEVVPIAEGELVQAQEVDEVIGPVRRLVLSGNKPNRACWKQLSVLSKILMRSWKKLKVNEKGLLVRETEKFSQVVLPSKYHQDVYVE